MTDAIERELELGAPPEVVWEALTDPTWLTEWLADEAELQLWPGGDARFRLGEESRAGWVEEVTPPSGGAGGRLAFWWERDGEEPGAVSRVALELTRTEDGCRLRVVESRPLDVLDLVGIPLGAPGGLGEPGGERFGPALVAA